MINNKTPFNIILDTYQEECFHLYAVLKSLNDYPDIFNEDFIDEDGLLNATSFALLCERFIFHTTHITGNYIDDFEELHHLLDIEMSLDWFNEELAKTKSILTKDLKEVFLTEKRILSFFSAIFKMEEESEPFVADYADALDFYENEIFCNRLNKKL
jgi:hypothetical protein